MSSPASSAFTDSTALVGDADALRARMAADGYLFLRGLVDRDALLAVRREIARLCQRHGWLLPGSDPLDAIVGTAPTREGDERYMRLYDDVQRLESFHALAHDAGVLGVIGTLVDEDVLAHPRNIARVIFPSFTRYTTPPHQDFVHIQGTEAVYTAWIPLGDCAGDMGGLEALAGSHRHGVLPPHQAEGAGGLGVDTDALGLTWVAGDMAAGDCLIFHSLTVHRGRDNVSADRLRLSVDYRYQGASQPVTEGSLLPHFHRLTWDEIYREWERGDLQYYWKKYELRTATFTRQWHEAAR